MTLEELAKWHEKMAAAHKRDFERYGNVAMVSEGVSAFAHHTAAAATIRAAMGEIERLRGPVTQYAKGYGPGDGDSAALNQKGPQDAG